MRMYGVAILMLAFAAPGEALQDQTVAAPREDLVLGTPAVGAPLSHENLSVFILEDTAARSPGEWITLEEGLKSGKVRVSETPQAQVAELLIENRSTQTCFVQAGDVVKGGQQDRAIATDLVVPPRSGKLPVPSFCVESGRWSGGGASPFGTTTGLAAGAALRAAIQKDKDQQKVWKAVEEAKRKLVEANSLRASSSTSLNEQVLDRKVQERLAGFMKALGKACDGKEKAVGLVTAVNGRLSGADLYADPGLFRKLYPRLLASAALEAISVPSREPKALTAADVLKFLAAADRAKPAGAASVREGARTLQFRTMHGGMELHRQSLAK
jgi:hypothetical protein